MPDRDVILTILHRADFANIAPFVRSLKHAGYTGHLVVFASAVGDVVCAKLRELIATVVPFHFLASANANLWRGCGRCGGGIFQAAPRRPPRKNSPIACCTFVTADTCCICNICANTASALIV